MSKEDLNLITLYGNASVFNNQFWWETFKNGEIETITV